MDIQILSSVVEEMAPKNGENNDNNPRKSNSAAQENVVECDIAEIEAVNNSLDSLSSALDFIEKRTDDIKLQLLELLNSNKEIRAEILEENAKAALEEANESME